MDFVKASKTFKEFKRRANLVIEYCSKPGPFNFDYWVCDINGHEIKNRTVNDIPNENITVYYELEPTEVGPRTLFRKLYFDENGNKVSRKSTN